MKKEQEINHLLNEITSIEQDIQNFLALAQVNLSFEKEESSCQIVEQLKPLFELLKTLREQFSKSIIQWQLSYESYTERRVRLQQYSDQLIDIYSHVMEKELYLIDHKYGNRQSYGCDIEREWKYNSETRFKLEFEEVISRVIGLRKMLKLYQKSEHSPAKSKESVDYHSIPGWQKHRTLAQNHQLNKILAEEETQTARLKERCRELQQQYKERQKQLRNKKLVTKKCKSRQRIRSK